MAKYSITKDPNADNVWALAQKDLSAIVIEVTKNQGAATVTFQKNASTKVRIYKGETSISGTELSPDPTFDDPSQWQFTKTPTWFENGKLHVQGVDAQSLQYWNTTTNEILVQGVTYILHIIVDQIILSDPTHYVTVRDTPTGYIYNSEVHGVGEHFIEFTESIYHPRSPVVVSYNGGEAIISLLSVIENT